MQRNLVVWIFESSVEETVIKGPLRDFREQKNSLKCRVLQLIIISNQRVCRTFLRLKVKGETFRLEVFCLIFSRCSTETIFVPIFVIFFSMFCLEKAFFRLSTYRENNSLNSSHLCQCAPALLNTCFYFIPSSGSSA